VNNQLLQHQQYLRQQQLLAQQMQQTNTQSLPQYQVYPNIPQQQNQAPPPAHPAQQAVTPPSNTQSPSARLSHKQHVFQQPSTQSWYLCTIHCLVQPGIYKNIYSRTIHYIPILAKVLLRIISRTALKTTIILFVSVAHVKCAYTVFDLFSLSSRNLSFMYSFPASTTSEELLT